MKRTPWIVQLDNLSTGPIHDWVRFQCTRCGGTVLAPMDPRRGALVAFFKVHSRCPEKNGG